MTEELRPCPECDGTGMTWRTSPAADWDVWCRRCGGTGVLSSEDDE